MKRATSYAERLRLNIAVIHGEEKDETERNDDGRSPLTPSEIEKSSWNSNLDLGLKLLPGEKIVISILSFTEQDFKNFPRTRPTLFGQDEVQDSAPQDLSRGV